MDPRLLEYYNRELVYLRELGAEFSQQFPKVASRLGMQGIDIADPYVERLFEGFAFLAARIHLKYDAEFPRFSQRLLEVVYPNYVAPTPAICIVQMTLPNDKAALADGFTLPRGSVMRSMLPKDERTACEFRTAHELTLWPLEIQSAKVQGIPPDIPLERVAPGAQVRAALRIRLNFTIPVAATKQLPDAIDFFVNGADEVVSRLYEQLIGHCSDVLVGSVGDSAKRWISLGRGALSGEGFEQDQALLPYEERGFQGYRLLHEYFACPQRFNFIRIKSLAKSLRALNTNSFEIVLLLDANCADLEAIVDRDYFKLHCTPAINLTQRRADRIAITGERSEYHVVIDRSRPLDYEVYSISDVDGFSAENVAETKFMPFYSSATDGGHNAPGAYYSVRREPRLISDTARRFGPRTSYVGSEVFVSLVDQTEAPFRSSLRQLGVSAWVTNRDLALLMPLGGSTDFSLVTSAPIASINVLRAPTRPTAAIAERENAWRLISHLSLNYLALTDVDDTKGAAALRELLELYGALAEPVMRKQIEGLHRVSVRAATRRLPGNGPLMFGRGVTAEILVDEASFAGSSPFLFGSVLDRFLARHVSINSFVETTLSSASRGKVHTWPVRHGNRPIA
jgi:type VI secretion system protein ImpG